MYIAEQIIKFIKEGKFKVGDKLPSERELARQLGVSRNPVREALSALRMAGIITSRPGDGTFVVSPNVNVEDRVQEILKKSGSPLEAWEARKVLEGKVTELAAVQATDEDVKALETALQQMEKAVKEGDIPGFFEADRDFHTAIAKATKNFFIQKALVPLIERIAHELWWEIKGEGLEDKEAFLMSLGLHRQIFLAIVERNPEEAHKNVCAHFEKLEKFIWREKDGR
jgi:GntR family transcriptional repressor for pyruvate dehydrogenase complex